MIKYPASSTPLFRTAFSSEPSSPPAPLENVAESDKVSDAHRRLLGELSDLRRELIDLAFDLEKRPRYDAADLAGALAHRLDALLQSGAGPS